MQDLLFIWCLKCVTVSQNVKPIWCWPQQRYILFFVFLSFVCFFLILLVLPCYYSRCFLLIFHILYFRQNNYIHLTDTWFNLLIFQVVPTHQESIYTLPFNDIKICNISPIKVLWFKCSLFVLTNRRLVQKNSPTLKSLQIFQNDENWDIYGLSTYLKKVKYF